MAPSNSGTIIVGIVMGLTASIGINLGNNIQAVALSKMTALNLEKKPRLWWLGTLMFAFASIINFAAFPFAPAAVLAPLESIQFVTNLAFAYFVNKRRITWLMLGGSALTIGGTIVTILFGPNTIAAYPSVDAVAELWTNAPWLIYLAGVLLFAFCLLAVHARYERARAAGTPKPMSAVMLPVTFAVSTAVFGSMCVVSAKAMGEIVTLFVDHPQGMFSGESWQVVAHWFFWVTLGYLLVCMTLWLGRLNAALRKYDPIFIIPLVQAHYIIFSVLSGGFFFEEFALMEGALAWAMFVLGIGVMLVGLVFLSPVNCCTRVEEDQPTELTPLKPDWDTSRHLLTYQASMAGEDNNVNGTAAEETFIGRALRRSLGGGSSAVDVGQTGAGGRSSIRTSVARVDPNGPNAAAWRAQEASKKSAKWVTENV